MICHDLVAQPIFAAEQQGLANQRLITPDGARNTRQPEDIDEPARIHHGEAFVEPAMPHLMPTEVEDHPRIILLWIGAKNVFGHFRAPVDARSQRDVEWVFHGFWRAAADAELLPDAADSQEVKAPIWTGEDLSTVVPSPSLPLDPAPHAQIVPSVLTA